MKHPHTAAALVAASLVGVVGAREIEHHKPLPLRPLPICEEVGDALAQLPPMRDASVVANEVTKSDAGSSEVRSSEVLPPTPLPPKRVKKKPVSRPQVSVIAPPERPNWTPLDWLADVIKAIFGVKS